MNNVVDGFLSIETMEGAKTFTNARHARNQHSPNVSQTATGNSAGDDRQRLSWCPISKPANRQSNNAMDVLDPNKRVTDYCSAVG